MLGQNSNQRLGRAGRIAGVLLMMALWLFLDAAAASSALHQQCCPDAGKPNDTCATAYAEVLKHGP